MNKLKKFFYGCLSRYSFHFFALQGIAITALTWNTSANLPDLS